MNTFKTSDGLNLAWYEWGSAEGPPVILHHGFGANAELNWVGAGIAKALEAAGRKVVAIDARGHGRSDKPHDPAFYGEARMAADVSELADHIGAESFDLVGYSMGAIVSLICATREPRIRRLVIGGVGDGILEMGGVDTRVVDNKAIIAALMAESAAQAPAAARGFRLLADATGGDRKALAAQAASVHAERIPLEKITAQAMVLVGVDDPLAARPERLAQAVAGAKLVRTPGDHMAAVRAPEFSQALVEFLS